MGEITFESSLTLIPHKQAASLRKQEQKALPKQRATEATHSTSKAISEPAPRPITPSHIITQNTPAGSPPPSKESHKPTSAQQYHQIRLVIADIPAKKIARAHRGILMPLSQVTDNLTFTLEVHVNSEAGISASTLEHKIKETIRQIGARLVVEEVGE